MFAVFRTTSAQSAAVASVAVSVSDMMGSMVCERRTLTEALPATIDDDGLSDAPCGRDATSGKRIFVGTDRVDVVCDRVDSSGKCVFVGAGRVDVVCGRVDASGETYVRVTFDAESGATRRKIIGAGFRGRFGGGGS